MHFLFCLSSRRVLATLTSLSRRFIGSPLLYSSRSAPCLTCARLTSIPCVTDSRTPDTHRATRSLAQCCTSWFSSSSPRAQRAPACRKVAACHPRAARMPLTRLSLSSARILTICAPGLARRSAGASVAWSQILLAAMRTPCSHPSRPPRLAPASVKPSATFALTSPTTARKTPRRKVRLRAQCGQHARARALP